MFQQTSLFGSRDPGPLRELLGAIDSGADNNTWILVSGGTDAEGVDYRIGDELENSAGAVVDLIHNGWFANRTVFIAYRRELARERDNRSEYGAMEGLEGKFRTRFAFYSVFKTLIRQISVQDLLDAIDGKDLTKLATTLRTRYAFSRALKRRLQEREEAA